MNTTHTGPQAQEEGLTERMYQALWFAQPFVHYTTLNAADPKLAKECLAAVDASIEEYRAMTSQSQRTPPARVVSDDVDPIHPCDLIQVMKDARGALDARHYNTFAAELQNATNIACELISAARIALSNLERNLHSEEACGSPFMGDDDHAVITILRNVLKRCDPENAALSTLQSGAEGKENNHGS
jgi:hypothetical protein